MTVQGSYIWRTEAEKYLYSSTVVQIERVLSPLLLLLRRSSDIGGTSVAVTELQVLRGNLDKMDFA